jgi:hypothetical protein
MMSILVMSMTMHPSSRGHMPEICLPRSKGNVPAQCNARQAWIVAAERHFAVPYSQSAVCMHAVVLAAALVGNLEEAALLPIFGQLFDVVPGAGVI